LQVGYNSRLATFNGHSFYPRPDNMVPKEFNPYGVYKTAQYERRILDSVDVDSFFVEFNRTFISGKDNFQGYDVLGNILLGSTDSVSTSFYGYYFYQALETLGYLVRTGSDMGVSRYVHFKF
jgi:hypothetical protein